MKLFLIKVILVISTIVSTNAVSKPVLYITKDMPADAIKYNRDVTVVFNSSEQKYIDLYMSGLDMVNSNNRIDSMETMMAVENVTDAIVIWDTKFVENLISLYNNLMWLVQNTEDPQYSERKVLMDNIFDCVGEKYNAFKTHNVVLDNAYRLSWVNVMYYAECNSLDDKNEAFATVTAYAIYGATKKQTILDSVELYNIF